MSRTEILEIVMPDGSMVDAEVSLPDSITDVGAQGRRLNLDEARESVASFVRWAVGSLALPAEGDAGQPSREADPSPPGTSLRRVGLEFGLKLAVKSGALTSVIAAVGGEATAVVRLEWERVPGGPR